MRPLVLNTNNRLKAAVTGHQYLLIAFPFGSVEVKNPQAIVHAAAATKLSLRGYRLLEAGSTPPEDSPPTLNIDLTYMQTSAYDFIFFRKIVCMVEMTAVVTAPGGGPLRQWRGSGRSSAFKGVAFAPQLEWMLNRAVDSAMDDVIHNLRL